MTREYLIVFWLSSDEPELLKAELRLTDIAELIGDNWEQVAERLGIPRADVLRIQSDYDDPIDQALAVLRQWMDENGSKANGNSLEKALRGLGMDDVITSCMINVADVTDAEEKSAAKSYLDAGWRLWEVIRWRDHRRTITAGEYRIVE